MMAESQLGSLMPEAQLKTNPGAASALARWWWVWAVCREVQPKTVLTFGSGTGPGCGILSHATEISIFCLVPPSQLQSTRDRWGGSSSRATFLSFDPSDTLIDQLWREKVGQEPPDLVVAFDSLEILPYRDLQLLSLDTLFRSGPPETQRRLLTSVLPTTRTQISRTECRIQADTAKILLSRIFGHATRLGEPEFPQGPVIESYLQLVQEQTPPEIHARISQVFRETVFACSLYCGAGRPCSCDSG